jgi:hypothetical protein
VLRKGAKKLLSVEVEEDQSFGRNFYFHGPHIRSLRSKPFNDTDMQLNMDELEPDIDQIQIEIEEAMRGSKNGYQENQLQEPSLMHPSRKSVRL